MYRDRVDAGRQLAEDLRHLADDDDLLVLGLPRGGVVVAAEVAAALEAPLDVLAVCKLGVPGHEELAMGAVASGGLQFVDEHTVRGLGISEGDVARALRRASAEAERRASAYRGDREPLAIAGRTVVLVDDGIATGSTIHVAAAALRDAGAGRVVVAVPVAPPATCEAIRREVDEVVCPLRPRRFGAVGYWYRDFSQTTDAEVGALLQGRAYSS